MNKTAKSAISLDEILRVFDDDKSLRLLKFIAGGRIINPVKLLDEFTMSHKEYYARISKLVEAGLISRIQGRYFLTSFGSVIFELYSILGEVIRVKHEPSKYVWLANLSEGP